MIFVIYVTTCDLFLCSILFKRDSDVRLGVKNEQKNTKHENRESNQKDEIRSYEISSLL